ncbi:MAG: tetratricopeptide repeat protein [Acidobacteria bacterium]|nr:tetratricopeptide repeat protein [Acidobacteriota bacterium]
MLAAAGPGIPIEESTAPISGAVSVSRGRRAILRLPGQPGNSRSFAYVANSKRGTVADLNEAGARFFRNQEPAEAAQCFRRSLELDPKQPRVAKLLGLSEQLTEDYERAKKAFTLAGELDPNDPEPWFYLGRVYYLENFFGQAIEELQKAIQIDSRDYRPHYYLALTFEAEGRIEAAEGGYRKAIELNLKRARPDFSPDYNYGVLLARMGRLEESEKHLKRSSELDPAAWAPPFELGKLYLRRDNLIGAERELISAAKAPTAGPDERSRIYHLLARVYFALGREGDAQKALAAREE